MEIKKRNSRPSNSGEDRPRRRSDRSEGSRTSRPRRNNDNRSNGEEGEGKRPFRRFTEHIKEKFEERRERRSSFRKNGEEDGRRPSKPFGRPRKPRFEDRDEERYNNEERREGFSERRSEGRGRRDDNRAGRRESFRDGGSEGRRTPRPFSEKRGIFGIRRKPKAAPKPRREDDGSVRLNKFIANSGVCSRREADTLIQSGSITVNGKVVTELGSRVFPSKDVVLMGDQRLRGEEKVYVIMNKPKGFVTTTSDPHADRTVMDLLEACPKRIFPVGRLDKDTTGVLLFTNDGEMAEKLTHPSFEKRKIYEVMLNRDLRDEDFKKILSGIELEDGSIAADDLSFVSPESRRLIGIEIHSGRNRIVRRIFESLGYEIKSLDRVVFAGLTKKGIKRGEWRYLTQSEVNILKMGAFN